MTLRIIELFSGVGAFSMALRNLNIPHERVAMCEIDEHAIKSYEAIHEPTPNLGDISLLEKLPECDLLTYSFPCQDLSIAGLRAGMSRDTSTRSGLLWEVERLLHSYIDGGTPLPKYLLMENVDAILHKTNIKDFRIWIRTLTNMGYTSSYEVLNAKDYGIPQNRKRCFMVSTQGDTKLEFPKPSPDGRILRDVLEQDVDDKYYLSEKALEGIKAHKERHDAKGNGFGFRLTDVTDVAGCVTASPRSNTGTFIKDSNLIQIATLNEQYESTSRIYDSYGISPTLLTCAEPKIAIRNATTKGYPDAVEGDGIVLDNYEARGRVQQAQSPTLMTNCNVGTVIINKDALRIRRLTPRECWRLMGFEDSDYDKAVEVGISETQLYRQAGNSIAVPCLESIFRAMFIDEAWIKTPSLNAFL